MTQPLKLRMVIAPYPHQQSIIDGSIQPDGIVLEPVEFATARMREMCRTQDYDVCELPWFSYIPAKHYGVPITAIPVLPLTRFHHADVTGNVRSGVNEPKDLEGKRVGVRGYTLTPGTWPRVFLADEYGVDLDAITYVSSEGEHVEQYYRDVPKNVVYEEGADLSAMLASGEIAGGLVITADSPDVKELIPNAREAALESARRRGMPTDRTIVIRDDVLAEHPWVVQSLFEAFKAAREDWASKQQEGSVLDYPLSDGNPLLTYGVEPNRRTLEWITDVAVQQRFVPRRFEVNEMFAPGTLELK